MIHSYYILIFFVILNTVLVINFSKIKFFSINVDKPDKIRKFHLKPTPLAGGQIIYMNILFYWILLTLFENLIIEDVFFQNLKSLHYFMIASSAIFLLGFIDDKFDLKPNIKFLCLLIIIFFLLFIEKGLIIDVVNFSFYNKEIFLNKFSIFFSVFCFLVFINAFNMFDGINLQSSLYSLFILFCLTIFFSNSLILNILILSLIAFSYLNFQNKTFLGDSGSLFLAFLISFFFIKFYNLNYINSADEIILYMMVPGLDLIRLFFLRIINKKNPLSSDRLHLHHLLISKYNLVKSLAIILTLIILPVMISYFFIDVFYAILISIFSYSFLIIYLSRKN